MSDYIVSLFYKFTHIDDPIALRDWQKELCNNLDIKGRILVGEEGINGTLEGTVEAVKAYEEAMWADDRFSDIVFKDSLGTGKAFTKLKVKVRDEIIALGVGKLDIAAQTAPTITAEELQEWYEKDDDFVVLDLRNDFEIQCGHFERTINPKLDNFRDLPGKLDELAEDPRLKGKKILTVCNGDIRCEKATCIMDSQKFPRLYHLEHGIFDYMKKFPNQHWKGTLFVFDDRTTDNIGAGPDHEVVGRCSFCEGPTEMYANDDSQKPSKKILCCADCFTDNKTKLRSFYE